MQERVVSTVKLRSTVPSGPRQPSHSPASAIGAPVAKIRRIASSDRKIA